MEDFLRSGLAALEQDGFQHPDCDTVIAMLWLMKEWRWNISAMSLQGERIAFTGSFEETATSMAESMKREVSNVVLGPKELQFESEGIIWRVVRKIS